MKTLSNMGFAFFGAALVAISYGLARFAFGLFVPSMSAELSITPNVIGIIGALPFVSFVLATLVAPLAADGLGARYLAMLSGLIGAAGLSLISQASSALMLSSGVFVCGICTGLMMPALTAAMQALVSRNMHGRVSSIMNAGTSIGIMVGRAYGGVSLRCMARYLHRVCGTGWLRCVGGLAVYSLCVTRGSCECCASPASYAAAVVAPNSSCFVCVCYGLCIGTVLAICTGSSGLVGRLVGAFNWLAVVCRGSGWIGWGRGE